jgi:hypothetical protein
VIEATGRPLLMKPFGLPDLKGAIIALLAEAAAVNGGENLSESG